MKNLLTSDEKATDFLLAHPGIIDTIKGDVEYEYNEIKQMRCWTVSQTRSS